MTTFEVSDALEEEKLSVCKARLILSCSVTELVQLHTAETEKALLLMDVAVDLLDATMPVLDSLASALLHNLALEKQKATSEAATSSDGTDKKQLTQA